MPPLRALKTDEEIAAIPLDQPILVELPGGVIDEPGEPDKTTGKTKQDEPDNGAKVLQEQLEASQRAQEAERARADKAERDAAEAIRRAAEADKRSQTLESDVITGGLAAAQAELAAAEAEMERAGEAGDFKAMAKAQSRIGRASAQVINLESGAAEIAERPKPEDRKEPPQQQQQPSFADQVRANANLLATERDWMLKHEQSFKDSDFNKKLEFAYQGAMRNGNLVRGSQAYFDYIERQTGLVTGGDDQDDNQGSRDVQAPPSRNERDGTGRTSPNRITLSPEQREIAKSMGVSEIDYARQVQAFEAAKKADPEKYQGR